MASTNISVANTKFGLDLFQRVSAEKKNENIFLSPFSISVALAMTHLGAREKTAAEMKEALKWGGVDESVIHKEFQGYLSLLQKSTNHYQLSTANRIYIEQSFAILDEFLKSTKDKYLAEPVAAQFKSNAEAERVNINSWVAKQTQDKIKDLIAPGVLDSLTRMVLVNAIYFKGQWESEFLRHETHPRTFKLAPSQTKEVPMMKQTMKYAMRKSGELQCTVLEIPYKGNELSMVILLPDEDFGLESLVSKLNEKNLTGLMKELGPPKEKIDLTLPKFEVTCSFSLKPVLTSMGMRDAFNEASANFAGMTSGQDVYISAVVHKAFVKVNEEGTEAAAATAVTMKLRCMPMPNPQFVVDHPFAFVIKDTRASNTILFSGTIVDPSLSE